MNKFDFDILFSLAEDGYTGQRKLAERCGYSLGTVNSSMKQLRSEGYLDQAFGLTDQALSVLEASRPERAVLLAAGFGMRMVPINMEVPKGLVEVKGQPLIERLICQLHEAGVREIYVVVGFMKERFEYLMDTYGVKLIVNAEYAGRNNLHSLALARKYLRNAYVVPCDLWCKNNPFRKYEPYTWYMVSDAEKMGSHVKVNRRQELDLTSKGCAGNVMLGIAYFQGDDSKLLQNRLEQMDRDAAWNEAFWEEAVFQKNGMAIHARVVQSSDVIEVNTYEQLRNLDEGSDQLKTEAIGAIMQALNAGSQEITDITVLKKGMTNRSFRFSCRDKQYIMRIPGEGTDQLINRQEEAAVYHAIDGYGLCDDIAYIDPGNGYKITAYLDHARVCDPENPEDVQKCMTKLRHFHELGLKVEHRFDVFRQIEFYESLWNGEPSVYRDYEKTKDQVLALQPYIDAHKGKEVLTHIDAVPDNFLFVPDGQGSEDLRLIDWEYAGMQDPHVDIAMFCIYAMYDREQVEKLIDAYFTEGCPEETRIKIYCYIAACGLLWSNWCEYKRSLGVEFGEYSLRQYRFAKEYNRIARAELERRGETI